MFVHIEHLHHRVFVPSARARTSCQSAHTFDGNSMRVRVSNLPGSFAVRDKIYITADGGGSEPRTIAVNPALPSSMARHGLW